jgi:hypothetical protein
MSFRSQSTKIKVNVHLPSLRMKVPDHVILRSLIYMSHVNNVQPIRVKIIRIAAVADNGPGVTSRMVRYGVQGHTK